MNLSKTFSRFKDSIFPLQTKSLRHLPALPSLLKAVLELASMTGRHGVVREPEKTTLQTRWC